MHKASRSVLALFALAASGCAAAVPAVRPWPGPPEGSACRVVVERGGGSEGWPLERYHAADGRILAGTTYPYAGQRGWERFVYDGAKLLRAIESYREPIGSRRRNDAGGASCEGCDASPLRTMTYVRLRYDDAGRLAGRAVAERTEHLQGGAWSERSSWEDETRYAYDAGGLLRERRGEAASSARFLYEGGRLVRVDGGAGSPSYQALERDGAGRVTRLVQVRCAPSGECRAAVEGRYAYDAEGRLVRAERSDPEGRTMPWVEEWEYAGRRVVRRTHTSARVNGTETRFVEYGYDAQGRLTSAAEDGRLRETRRYEGACDALNTGPAEPSVEAQVGARLCPMSPAQAMDHCAEP